MEGRDPNSVSKTSRQKAKTAAEVDEDGFTIVRNRRSRSTAIKTDLPPNSAGGAPSTPSPQSPWTKSAERATSSSSPQSPWGDFHWHDRRGHELRKEQLAEKGNLRSRSSAVGRPAVNNEGKDQERYGSVTAGFKTKSGVPESDIEDGQIVRALDIRPANAPDAPKQGYIVVGPKDNPYRQKHRIWVISKINRQTRQITEHPIYSNGGQGLEWKSESAKALRIEWMNHEQGEEFSLRPTCYVNLAERRERSFDAPGFQIIGGLSPDAIQIFKNLTDNLESQGMLTSLNSLADL